MKLNPKVTGALAWGGLVLVLAVPAADMVTRTQGDAASVFTSGADRVDTASATTRASGDGAGKAPVAVQVPAVADPIDAYMASGKKLPSYISDAPAAVAASEPAPTIKLEVPALSSTRSPATAATQAVKPAVSTQSLEVASVDPTPALVAPEPYPASMRPQTRTVASVPATTAPATTAPGRTPAPALTGQPGAPAPQDLAGSEAPLILDEDTVARREAAVARVLETPPAGNSPRRIEGDRLQEWDSGSLADYLERRGLINDQPAQVQTQAESSFGDEVDFYDDRYDRSERRVVRRLPRDDFFLF